MKQNAQQGNKIFHWKLAKCFLRDLHMIHECFMLYLFSPQVFG